MSALRTLVPVITFASLAAVAPAALAQMPGVPVLQNAFVAPGIVVAADFGGGAGSTYAGAIAWAPSSARFQLSGSYGVHTALGGGSSGTWGARASAPLFSFAGNDLGLGVFAGAGGSSAANAADTLYAARVTVAGASFGFRHALGNIHGFSAYGAPFYMWTGRAKGGVSSGMFRASFGLDAAITRSIGATVGVETGQAAPADGAGPTGTMWGAAVSFAFGRH